MTASKNLILVRHGSLDRQYDGCYIGSSDLALSAVGIREAEAIAESLRTVEISLIISSPLLRARQTLEKIAIALPRVPVVHSDLLCEIDFGNWEGLTFDQISKSDPDGASRWAHPNEQFAFPGGESITDFYVRVSGIKQMLLDSPHDNFLLVSHGGVIRTLICNVLDIPPQKSLSFKIERGSVSTMSLYANGLGTLNTLNYRPGS